jgi:predicted SnoaL-like aldol condensation-catalyzing enzyme
MSGRNKQVAISFLGQAMTGDVREAFREYVAEDLIHHDARLREGAQALMDAMHADQVLYPARVFMIEHALQDGDLAAVHARAQQAPTEPERMEVYIFRFQNGLIHELWHVSEPVPDEVLNSAGAF